MATYRKVEVTIMSARNLKNVNWKHGDLRPYAAVWVEDQNRTSTTRVAYGEDPVWDQELDMQVPDYKPLEDCSLYIDIFHDDSLEPLRKKIVGSGKLPLLDVLADTNNAGKITQTITLRRPSGRPQGTLDVKVCIRKVPVYGYGNPAPVPYPTPVSGYTQPAYGYGSASAPSPPPTAPHTEYVTVAEPAKKKGVGLGTGLAVGAAAGLLGGLVLAEGVEHLEDEIAEKAAKKVEEDRGTYYPPAEGSYYQPDDWSF